jgi:hypothetical protein
MRWKIKIIRLIQKGKWPSAFAMCGIFFSARLANEADMEGANASNYQKLMHRLRQTNGARG